MSAAPGSGAPLGEAAVLRTMAAVMLAVDCWIASWLAEVGEPDGGIPEGGGANDAC